MKVSDIAEIKMGYAFRSRIEHSPLGNIPVIQPKDISDNGLLQEDDICRVEMESIKPGQILAAKDVLLANRGRFASTVYAGQLDTACIASGSIMVLTVKEGQPALPEYLALYFNSKMGKRQLNRFDETTTIPFISRANLEQMEIPIPTLEQQRAMIALEKTKQRYTQLTKRKLELLNNILNHQLSTID